MNYIAYEIRDTKMDNLRVHSEISKPKVGFLLGKHISINLLYIILLTDRRVHSIVQFNSIGFVL